MDPTGVAPELLSPGPRSPLHFALAPDRRRMRRSNVRVRRMAG
jgi:hypothetical protein